MVLAAPLGGSISEENLVAKNNVLEPSEEVTVTVTRTVTQNDFDANPVIQISLSAGATARLTGNAYEKTLTAEVVLPLQAVAVAALTADPKTVTSIGEGYAC